MRLDDTLDWLKAQPVMSAAALDPQTLVERWQLACGDLCRTIAHQYLLEYGIRGDIAVSTAIEHHDFYHIRAFDLELIAIRAGDRFIAMRPEITEYHRYAGRIRLVGGDPSVFAELFCDLSEPQPTWWTVADRNVVDRVLLRTFPPRHVRLDKINFSEKLSLVILGKQSLLSDKSNYFLSRPGLHITKLVYKIRREFQAAKFKTFNLSFLLVQRLLRALNYRRA